MELTSVGHACWIIKTTSTTIITDPVLMDPFEQGTVTACPSREIQIPKLPKLDAIFISHRHLDHFHVPTLKKLPTNIPVFIPDDRLTKLALQQIGFQDIRTMKAFVEQKVNDDFSLIPLPSITDDFIEHGAIFVHTEKEKKYTILNQVDTPLSDDIIEVIKSRFKQIDVHLAMYASQDFGWFNGQPEQIAETYTQNLHVALSLEAKLVVPAAAGFRFVDRFDYLNHLLFPISQERFISDVKKLSKNSNCEAINPGDVLQITDTINIQQQAAEFVKMVENDLYRINYDPTGPVPKLVDENPNNYPVAHLRHFVTTVIEQGMTAYLNAALQIAEKVAMEYRQHNATYRVEVVLPDGELGWSFSFSDSGYTVYTGDDAPRPDARWRITGSALLDLCEGKKGCWAIRPESRKWSNVLLAKRTPVGIRAIQFELPDLLTHFILNMQIRSRGEEQAMLSYFGLT